MAESSPHDALRTIAAWSLDSRELAPVRFDPRYEDQLLAEISRERLAGFALAAVTSGLLALSAPGLDDLFVRHEQQLALDLRLEQVLVAAADRLQRAGIDYRALKGPLLGRIAYDDPALRSFGDVDVLVRGAQFDAAVGALQALGFERGFIEPRAGFDARFSKGSCLERGDGMELDLHRTLAPGAFGILLARTDLFSRPPIVIDVAGHPITGLDRETAFVHACFHAALGNHPPRLVPLRDIVQLYNAGVDDSAVMARARSARSVSVLRRAFALVDEQLGMRLEGALPTWVREYRPSRFDRWALQSYATPDRSYAGQIATSLWVLPSLRERAAFGAALAFPTRDYVRARERGYGRRLARGLRVANESRPR